MKMILRNSIRCNHCGKVIVSKSRHDYQECKCGRCGVDGGYDYFRRVGMEEDDYTDLSIEYDFKEGDLLRTKDGRKIGNAIIYALSEERGLLLIRTDFGNRLAIGMPSLVNLFHVSEHYDNIPVAVWEAERQATESRSL